MIRHGNSDGRRKFACVLVLLGAVILGSSLPAARALAETRPTELTYMGRVTVSAATVGWVNVGFGDLNKASVRAVVPFEITLRERWRGGPLEGEVIVQTAWQGTWAGRMSLPRRKQASGSVTGSGPFRVKGRFDPDHPDEVRIWVDGLNEGQARILGLEGYKVEVRFHPDPKAVLDPGFSFLLFPDEMLDVALFDAFEEKGFGRFKVQGGDSAIRVSGERQLGYLAWDFLHDEGSYSITASLRPVRSSAGRRSPLLFMNDRQLLPDVPPVIVDGRTLAPLRLIGEALGADVFWNGEDRSVHVQSPDGRRVVLKIGEKQAKILMPRRGEASGGAVAFPEGFDVREIELDVPAQVVEGRTLVPLRFIAELELPRFCGQLSG